MKRTSFVRLPADVAFRKTVDFLRGSGFTYSYKKDRIEVRGIPDIYSKRRGILDYASGRATLIDVAADRLRGSGKLKI
jgi:hypothetical protein